MKFVMPKPRLVFMIECDACTDAQKAGVKDLIFHYAEKHCIPTEWPSERAARLTGTEATKPYTTIAATRKRRRKQTTPRPLNSFMIFAQHIRRNVLAVFEAASSSDVSRLLGDAWNAITKDIRAAYDDEAARLSKLHNIEFPDYKYQPRPRQLNPTAISSRTDIVAATTTPVLESASLSDGYKTSPPSNKSWSTARSDIIAKASAPVINLVQIKPEPPSPPPFHNTSLKSKPLIRDILPIPAKVPKLNVNQSLRSTDRIPSSSSCSYTPSPPPQIPIVRLDTPLNHQPANVPTQSSLVATLPLLQSLISQLSAQQRPLNDTASVVNLIAHIPVQEKPIVAPPPQSQQAQISLQSILAQIVAQQAAKSSFSVEQQPTTCEAAVKLSVAANTSVPLTQVTNPPPPTPKPCVLLTPIQSDVGQQAILACGQSSAMPTLLTCGNTIYVALSVLQSPLPTNAVIMGAPAGQFETPPPTTVTTTTNGSVTLSELVQSLQMAQTRPNAESRLAELLRAAQSSAAASTGQ